MRNLGMGIDKIQLKYDLDNNALVTNIDTLSDIPGWKASGDPVKVNGIWMPSGYSYQADKVHTHNNGHLTMKLIGNGIGDKSHLSVMYNPTHFGDGYTPTIDIKATTNKAQKIVMDAGIDIDLNDGRLMRLDIAKDRKLSETPGIYAHILATGLSFSREKTKQGYADGMYMGNRSRQLGFYDRHKKVNLDNIPNDLPLNTARLEYRLFNAGHRSWSNQYSITKLGDLTNDLDQYQEIYSSGMGMVFTNKVLKDDKVILPPSELYNVLMDYKRKYNRNGFSYYFNHNGVIKAIDDHGLDTLINVASQVFDTETKKLRQRVRNMYAQSIMMTRTHQEKKRPSVEYIQEIYNEYAKAS